MSLTAGKRVEGDPGDAALKPDSSSFQSAEEEGEIVRTAERARRMRFIVPIMHQQ